jgi:tetratricopeptide (TPR) repeat protein
MQILGALFFMLLTQDVDTLVRRAELKYKERDIDGAVADYTQAIALDSRCAAAYFGRGQIHANKGQMQAAQADYSKAVECDPKFAKAWFGRGMLRTYTNDPEGALADFTKAVEADPAYTLAWFNRALLRLGRKDHDGAIGDYTKAIALKPQDADMYVGRGNAYAAKGDHDKAISDYAKAIELKPGSSSAYVYKGDSEMKKGDPIGAMLTFSKAIEVNPKDAEAYYFRGYANYDRRAFKESGEDFQKAYDLNRLTEFRTDMLQLRLWVLKARAGQAAEANSLLKRYATKEHRGYKGDWFNQIASFLTGDLPEDQFLNLAGNKDQTCDAHFYAGVKKVIAKDLAAAKTHFKKAVDSGANASNEYWSAMSELEGVGKEK